MGGFVLDIAIGQVFKRQIDEKTVVAIEIKKIDVANDEIWFTVTGDQVIDPDIPRIMPILQLTGWLDRMPAPKH